MKKEELATEEIKDANIAAMADMLQEKDQLILNTKVSLFLTKKELNEAHIELKKQEAISNMYIKDIERIKKEHKDLQKRFSIAQQMLVVRKKYLESSLSMLHSIVDKHIKQKSLKEELRMLIQDSENYYNHENNILMEEDDKYIKTDNKEQ